jgi:hypothetical protein
MNKISHFLYNYRTAILAWLLIAFLIVVGVHYDVDEVIIGLVVLVVGLLGQAFAALIAWIGLIPLFGPFVAKVLTIPFFWILNSVGYLASIVAIRRGYSRDVVNYRILTFVLLVGVTIGYVLAKIV